MRRSLFSLILWLGLAAPTLADVVHLVGGGALEGQVVSEEKGLLVVRTANGSTIVVPREQVREVERGASVEELHRARLRRIDPRDAEARYALGLWLKSLRRPDLARREFLAVLLLSPDHRFARGELGQTRHKGEWLPIESTPAGFGGTTLTRDDRERSQQVLPGGDLRELLSFELGCSPELAGALVEVRGRDRARARAARALLQDLAAERLRLSAAVRGQEPGGALAWAGVVANQEGGTWRGGCHGRRPAPAAAELESASLEALLEGHVERKLAPALKVLVPELQGR